MDRAQLSNADRWIEGFFQQTLSSSVVLYSCPEFRELQFCGECKKIRFLRKGSFPAGKSDLAMSWYDLSTVENKAAKFEKLPLVGLSGELLIERDFDNGLVIIGYDVPQFVFWTLNRLEEIDRSDLDAHGRFPASQSHAFSHNYLEIPVVDRWIRFLEIVALMLGANLNTDREKFRVCISHDVDRPSWSKFESFPTLCRMLGSALLKDSDLQRFKLALRCRYKSRINLIPEDPYNWFSWIMNFSETNGLQSTFNFLCSVTSKRYDGGYKIEDPPILGLLREIGYRGHRIGLHPSYNSCMISGQIEYELGLLKAACERVGIFQQRWSSRMHYLRWRESTLLQELEKAGIHEEHTGAFPDHIGFKFGTSKSFRPFNTRSDIAHEIEIYPLICMDTTLFGDLSDISEPFLEDSFTRLSMLKAQCHEFGGNFSILWHNDSFGKPSLREFYTAILT